MRYVSVCVCACIGHHTYQHVCTQRITIGNSQHCVPEEQGRWCCYTLLYNIVDPIYVIGAKELEIPVVKPTYYFLILTSWLLIYVRLSFVSVNAIRMVTICIMLPIQTCLCVHANTFYKRLECTHALHYLNNETVPWFPEMRIDRTGFRFQQNHVCYIALVPLRH